PWSRDSLRPPDDTPPFVGEEPLYLMRDARADFAFEQVQPHVQTGRYRSTGHEVAVVDDTGVDRVDTGRDERVHAQVMRRGGAAGNQSCHGEERRATADRGHSDARPGKRFRQQRREPRGRVREYRWDRVRFPGRAWHDDQVRALRVEPSGGTQGQQLEATVDLSCALCRDEFGVQATAE